MLAALVNGVKGGKWYSLWDKVCDRKSLSDNKCLSLSALL
jgi:hypothetical protein